jgi:SOS response regulatory protein OraA/RecX
MTPREPGPHARPNAGSDADRRKPPRAGRQTPIRVWNAAPRDGSARLTEIRTVRDDPACVWILLDGVRAGIVDRATASRLDLAGPPRPWTADLAEQLDREVRDRLCDRSAVRLLAARMRSREGLVRALVQRGHDRAIAQACADRHAREGAVDDARYAEIMVRNELARKPAGRRLLEARLRAHGVSGEPAARALDEALEGRDEIEDARRVAASAARAFRPDADPETVRRRLSARLARRGFDHDTVRRVVEEIMADRCDGDVA